MSWFRWLWLQVVAIGSRVLRAFLPALRSWVAAEAAGYMTIVRELVAEAETRFGSGPGQAKYGWVVEQLRLRLGDRFAQTRFRVFDLAIHAAVAEISGRQ